MNRLRIAVSVVIVLGAALVTGDNSLCVAGATSWNHDPATPGDWFESGNWTNGVPRPGAGNVAYVNNGGTAQIGGTGEVVTSGVFAGFDGGSGRITQTGGKATVGGLNVGFTNDPSSFYGTYELMAGELNVAAESVGGGNATTTARFVHTGGIHRVDRLGIDMGGTYELGGSGQLVAGTERLGESGPAMFIQSAGTHTVTGELSIRPTGNSAQATYQLTAGQLSAVRELLGGEGYDPEGRFEQSGGLHSAEYLVVRSHGTYLITGGILQLVDGGLDLHGILDFGGSTAVVRGGDNTCLNFSQGSVLNSLQASIETGRNSLTIFPAGFDPTRDLASFRTAGLVHVAGNELVIPAGQGFSGAGVISDYVRCEGMIAASPGKAFELRAGVTVAEGGYVDLGEQYSGYEHDFQSQVFKGIQVLGGELHATTERLEHASQTGGLNAVKRALLVQGEYALSGGGLSAAGEAIGYDGGDGVFIHTGGTNSTESLGISQPGSSDGPDHASGRYHLTGGELTARREQIGNYKSAPGQLIQTGGKNTAETVLVSQSGTYDLRGGALVAGELRLIRGALKLSTASAAQITVTNRLAIEDGSRLAAPPGAAILMSGATFENQSTAPGLLVGLGNLRLVFEGGTAAIDQVEVAGRDLGPLLRAFENNFALGTLQLGATEVGQIRLVDDFDNQPLSLGHEALYVTTLNVGASSYLDLNGLNLYYLRGTIDPTATILENGGNMVRVPEPATLVMLVALAATVALARGLRRARPTP